MVKTLGVIIPVYNEENTIQFVLRQLSKVKLQIPELRITVINDGSTDGTLSKITAIPEEYDLLINLKANSGKGEAVRQGILATDCDYLIIQDADLEYNPEEIPRLWQLVRQNDIDLLMTSRLNGSQFTRVHYFWHKVGNRILTFFFNVLFNTTFTDIYSGYLLFRKEIIDANKLKITGWGQQAELLTKLLSKGSKIYETPISYHGRTYEEGKKIRAVAIFEVLLTIVRFRLQKRKFLV